MTHSLRLRFEADSEGAGELFATVHADGFSGIGSAWFDENQLIQFSQNLAAAYPLSPNEPLKLEGGFYSNSGKCLEQLPLGLKFYPIGSTGQIGCRVILNTATYEHDRPEEQSSVALELHTTFEQLGTFARSLEALVKGNADEAILETVG